MTNANSPESQNGKFVTVVFAEDVHEVEYFKAILEDHGIEVIVGEDAEEIEGSAAVEENLDDISGRGIPVRVMYENLADAENVIERVSGAEEEFDSSEEYDDSDEDEFVDFGEIDPNES